MVRRNPCLSCGACCACYRVSFHWMEGADVTDGGVPLALTEPLLPHRLAMRGTNQPNPRCIALEGVIGASVACSIHPERPSVCREFVASYEHGTAEPRCDEARARHGLPPLRPEDWINPDLPPLTELDRPHRAA